VLDAVLRERGRVMHQRAARDAELLDRGACRGLQRVVGAGKVTTKDHEIEPVAEEPLFENDSMYSY